MGIDNIDDKMQCHVGRIEFAVSPRDYPVVTFFLEHGHKPDMGGTVQVALFLQPEARQIFVLAPDLVAHYYRATTDDKFRSIKLEQK
jgi:hypothetical protein